MRIGLFTDTYAPDINGVVSSIMTLQESLIEQGHDVFIITTKHGLLSIKFENNVLRLPGIEIKKMYGYILTTPMQFRAYNIVKEMKLDIIHVHTEFGVGVFGHIVGKMLKLPIVSTYHTTYEDYTHYVNTFNLKSVESIAKKTVIKLSRIFGSSSIAIIAPSEKTKEMLLRYGIKREIFVVPTGLNLERFDNSKKDVVAVQNLKEKAGISANDKVVVFVGRLAKEKSIDLIIDGFKLVAESHRFIKLIIVGGGPSEEALHQKVRSLNLNEQVVFLGKIPSVEIPSIYHMADAFISASLTETQGLTFIEAMAAGLPLFARFDYVISDLLIDDETGYYFDNPETMANVVMQYFLLPQEKQDAMSKKAKKSVKIYDRRFFAQRVTEVYQKAQKLYHTSYLVERLDYRGEYVKLHISSAYEKMDFTLLFESLKARGIKENAMISSSDIELISKDEKLALAYKECIRKLAYKDRTRKEIYDFLSEKTSLDAYQMNKVIDLLEAQNLINDEELVKSAVSYYRSLLIGKRKIVNTLIKRGIPPSLLEEHLLDDDSSFESQNALRLATKYKEKLTGVSVNAKRDKIRRKLVQDGYDSNVINHTLSILDFKNEYTEEEENCKKVAVKLRENYTKRNIDQAKQHKKLVQALANKGFEYDLIKRVLEDLEGDYYFEND